MSQFDPSGSGAAAATQLRRLLGKADLTAEAAATVLDLDAANVRAYVAAEKPVPRYLILALERIVAMRMGGR